MANFKMMVVDDDEGIRKLISDFLDSKGIECEVYASAEALLTRLYPSAVNDPEFMPDLIIIDLKLDREQNFTNYFIENEPEQMQGIDLIKELTSRNAPCELIAISGAIPSLTFTDDIICFGAAFLLAKPFALEEQFYPRAIRLAEIGKKKRLKSVKNPFELHDETRKDRPVFLSYAEEDRHLANGIRRHLESFNIDVWYAPITIKIGAEWNQEIRNGIRDATIFVPLISDHFIASGMCLNELDSFRNRMEAHSKSQLLLLPVVDDLSEESRKSDLFKSIERRYHYNRLRPRVSDCLTSLINTIRIHITKG